MIARQRTQRDFFAEPVALHLGLVALQRMIGAFNVFGTKGPGDQQALICDPLAKMPQQIDARRIGPVQVLQQQHHGGDCRKGAQSITHLTHHALFGGANRLLLQTLERSGRGESGRQLRTPGGCMCAHDRCKTLAPWSIEQCACRVEKRQISLAGAVLLDAASPGNEHPRIT